MLNQSITGDNKDASNIKLSTVGEVVAKNYNLYHLIANQLRDLQQWVKEQSELK